MIRVLLVCTGNVCRTPMATALLRRRLDERNVEADVTSAGLLEAGRPVEDGSVRALRAVGLDAGDHRSRRLDARMVCNADLVLGMERRHVREAVLLVPQLWPRAFTLRELVRRAQAVGPRRDEPFGSWLDRVQAGRSHAEYAVDDDANDVADPMGLDDAAYAETVAVLDELIDDLVELAWPESSPIRREPGQPS